MNNLKAAVKKATGHEVKYIFSYNLSPGGYVDYGTGDKTYSIKIENLEL